MTQVQMTDQQLNRALAELMGWTDFKEDGHGGMWATAPDFRWTNKMPDYCTDPAASLEVQAAATKVNAKVYVDTLYDIRLTNEGYTPEIAIGESTYSHDGVVYLFDATPRERAEAAYITLQGAKA